MESINSSNTNNEEVIDLGKSRMKNMGNTCYMNSIIQCLNHTPLLREFILNNLYIDDLKENIINEFVRQSKKEDPNFDRSMVDENDIKKIFKTTIIYQYHRIIKIMWEKNCLVTPASFRRLVGRKNDMFAGYNQHDSQEFLIFILDQIHEEVSRKINVVMGNEVLPAVKKPRLEKKSDDINNEKTIVSLLANRMWNIFIRNQYSVITELFTGMYHSILESKNCGNKSHAFDPFTCLSVAIPLRSGSQAYLDLNKTFTIYDCLDNFFTTEELKGDNKITCERTMEKVEANKKISLWSAPKLLIIQIKRFMKNPYGYTTRKLKNKVTYPVKGLDLTKYTSEYNKKTYKYNLFAVNVHSDFGGMNSGHYYSYCKNITDNNWYCYNDENVVKINKVQNSDAYLLFYYRVD